MTYKVYSLRDSDFYNLAYFIRLKTGLLSNSDCYEVAEVIKTFCVRQQEGELLANTGRLRDTKTKPSD